MRSSRLLNSLITATKQRILAATLLQPDHEWYLNELARRCGVQPSSLQRDLKVLTEAGILRHRKDGNRSYFQADRTCPIFSELARILDKTVGVVDVLGEALQSLSGRIDVAFVYGSLANASEESHSDVDLFIVGGVSLSEIATVLREVERQVGRPVNPSLYTRKEFVKRIGKRDHFTTAVLENPVLFVIGGRNELAAIVAERSSEGASNELARTG